ncbi:hypothetical protein PLICRDRAFT_241850 [Plicaturopsis crispa FD-325 SS-3]|nr:hypothetical protein PLICRDRAFT_241850 [Plicaturopsis crispa FD-325 SS-3]
MAAPFSYLPPELIYMIFRFAAASSRRTALALCAVSSWARWLALPYALRTVVVCSHTKSDFFIDPFTGNIGGRISFPMKPALDHADHLRNLWYFPSEISTLDLCYTLQRCKNLVNIATTKAKMLGVAPEGQTSHIDFDRWIERTIHRRELRLTVEAERVLPSSWTRMPQSYGGILRVISPVLKMVTHLRLGGRLCQNDTLDLHLKPLTRLRFLAIRISRHTEDFRHLVLGVLHSPLLEMLVLELDSESDTVDAALWLQLRSWVLETRRTDPRVFFALHRAWTLHAEWLQETVNGYDIWKRAIEETKSWEGRRLRLDDSTLAGRHITGHSPFIGMPLFHSSLNLL